MDTEEVRPTQQETGAEAEVAEAAVASADATTAAIEEAAEVNDDPEVAGALEKAAVQAEKTAGRVGWLRAFVRRISGGRA